MHHQCAMRNSFKKTMFGARSSLRVFRSSTIYSHHSRKICSFSQDHDPGSWESMEGLLRCPANFVPLSPISFLERAAKVCRDRTSLVYGSLEYNWGETHQRCLKLASAITHLGISRGDVVSSSSAINSSHLIFVLFCGHACACLSTSKPCIYMCDLFIYIAGELFSFLCVKIVFEHD